MPFLLAPATEKDPVPPHAGAPFFAGSEASAGAARDAKTKSGCVLRGGIRWKVCIGATQIEKSVREAKGFRTTQLG